MSALYLEDVANGTTETGSPRIQIETSRAVVFGAKRLRFWSRGFVC